jgi:hypothetical protein
VKHFDGKPVAQGDVMIVPWSGAKYTTPISAENGHFIITHSESGHHHIVMERPDIRFSAIDEFRSYLEADEPFVLEHLRSFDTHESIEFPAGKYEVRRQREYVAEGFRRAAD